MTEFRVNRRSDLGTGEVGDGRNDVPMDVVMEMSTAATSITAETGGSTIFEAME
jgi:hypothetical protein